MNKRKKYLIKDIIEGLYDGPHATPKESSHGPIFLGIKNITEDGHFDLSQIRHIAPEDFSKWTKRVLPRQSDIVFTYEATLNRYAIIPDNMICCLGRRMALIRVKQKVVSPEYLYYYFFSKEWRNVINQNTIVGATVNRIPISDFPEFPVYLPSLTEQQKIADILSALDSKIKINNRINEKLEAMAKLIYNYWFVQFDFPDVNGKSYKSSGGKIVHNVELKRELPEGWEVKDIDDVCEVIDCLHSRKPDFYQTGCRFLLQLENIKDDGTIDISKKYLVSNEDYEKWTSRIEVKEGDIVITNAGRVGAFAQIPKGLITGIGRNITAIRPKGIMPTFLFYYFGSVDIQRQISQNTDAGAFFNSLNVKGIKLLKVISPPETIIKSFEQKARPIRTAIENNIIANQKLKELRDWLLPMLMNGQVTVAEAEERVAMAAEPEAIFGKQGEFGF